MIFIHKRPEQLFFLAALDIPDLNLPASPNLLKVGFGVAALFQTLGASCAKIPILQVVYVYQRACSSMVEP